MGLAPWPAEATSSTSEAEDSELEVVYDEGELLPPLPLPPPARGPLQHHKDKDKDDNNDGDLFAAIHECERKTDEGEQVVQAQGGDRDALASQVSQGRKVPTTERQGTPSRVQFVRHFTP